VTDASGVGTAHVVLPHNLTTFRVIAVAASAGDQYGSADTSLLVTQPLVARPALPRFVRPGDAFDAGPVVSRRDGHNTAVRVTVAGDHVTFGSDTVHRTEISESGKEIPFAIRLPATARDGDTAAIRFTASDNVNADAVETRLPIKPTYHPRAWI